MKSETTPIAALDSSGVDLLIYRDAETAGRAAVEQTAAAACREAARGKNICFWLMAAPSGFAFYRAFVDKVREDRPFAEVVAASTFFQFDDYPIGRDDPAFRVTFRSLLEKHLIGPLETVLRKTPQIEFLELTGNPEDREIAANYTQSLCRRLDDPGVFVIEIKGIGMDGHWGFHDGTVPLTASPSVMHVALSPQNIHQQMIDWPEYFGRIEDVPTRAYTANTALLLMADLIIDVVPQASKRFSILATYATDAIVHSIPSSAIKRHTNAAAYLTEEAASVLLSLRRGNRKGRAKLTENELDELKAVWAGTEQRYYHDNVAAMLSVLKELCLLD